MFPLNFCSLCAQTFGHVHKVVEITNFCATSFIPLYYPCSVCKPCKLRPRAQLRLDQWFSTFFRSWPILVEKKSFGPINFCQRKKFKIGLISKNNRKGFNHSCTIKMPEVDIEQLKHPPEDA